MIVNRRRETQLKSGLFERVIDDTNFIEKIVFILWFGTGGMFYLMFDWFDMWIRVLISIGMFVVLSLIIYGFAKFMSSEERHWN